jgi:hypothetical protein
VEDEEKMKDKKGIRTEEVEKEDVKGKQRENKNEYLMLSI